MSKIHNEYSPINPPAISTSTSQNDGIINGILPARRTINIRGLRYSDNDAWHLVTRETVARLIGRVGGDLENNVITRSNGAVTWLPIYYDYNPVYNQNIDSAPAGYYRLHIDDVYGGAVTGGNDPRKGRARIAFLKNGMTGYYQHLIPVRDSEDWIDRNDFGDFKLQLDNYGNIDEGYGVYPKRGETYDDIVYVPEVWTHLVIFPNYNSVYAGASYITSFKNLTLDYIGPTLFTKKEIYWTPSPTEESPTKVIIPNPAETPSSILITDTLKYIGQYDWDTQEHPITLRPRENTDTYIDSGDLITLKGFATKSTVEEWIDADGFDEYYNMLTDDWDSGIKASMEDVDENFMLDRYLDTDDFPYDVLFECDVDIPIRTSNGQQYIEFDSAVGFEEQDIFAIYERKKYNYNFYYADGSDNIYATKSVYYGDTVGNPTQEDAGNNQLPSTVGTTYRLTSSTSGGVTTWTATQAAQTQGDGYTYASTKTAISTSSPWKIRGTNTIANMSNVYASDTGNHNYEINMITTIPVVCVIDGEIETGSSGYCVNSDYSCTGSSDLYDYIANDFWGIELGQRFDCDLSGFKIFKANTQPSNSIPLRDTSFINQNGWFLNANCTSGYISGSTALTSSVLGRQSGDTSPIILYQKTTKMCSVKFDVRSETGYSFVKETSLTSDLDTRVSYSYTPQGASSSSTFNLTAPTWLDNTTLLAPQGTVLKITDSNIKYRYVSSSSETIGDAVSWADDTDNSVTITRPVPPAEYNAFAIHDDYFMVPTIDNVNKPTVNVTCKSGFSINTGTFVRNNKTYTSTLQSESVYKIVCMSADADSIDNAVTLDLSWVDVTDSNATENFEAFVEDGVRAITTANRETSQGLFTVSGVYQSYRLYSTGNLSASNPILGYYRLRIDNVYDKKVTDDPVTYPDNSGKTARISFSNTNNTGTIYHNVYVSKGTPTNPVSTDLIFNITDSRFNQGRWGYMWILSNLASTASDRTNTYFQNISLYYLGASNPYINMSSISLKSGESKNINTYTTKNANISVDSLKFFRKNNSTNYSPHSEADYDVNIYIDGALITKRYKSGGDMSNLIVSGTQITNVEIVDRSTSNLAIFKGLSTDNTDNNIITYPYTITGGETLYIRWQKPTYGVSLSYMLSDSITASIMSTTLTYDPINGTSQTLYPTLYTNARDANSLKVAIECPKFSSEYTYETHLASDTTFKAIFLDSAGIVCKVGNTTFNNWTISDLNVDFDTIRRNGTISGNTCSTEISYYLKIAEDKLYDIIDDRSYTGNIHMTGWVQSCLDTYNMPIYLGTGQNNFSNLRVSAESGVTDVHRVQYNLIQYDNGNPIYCMKFKIYDNR